jgi:hypothetical protein
MYRYTQILFSERLLNFYCRAVPYIFLTYIIYYILAEREAGKRGNRLIRPERPLPKPGALAEAEPGLGRPSSSHWGRGGWLSNSVADPSHFDTDPRIRYL